jgi:uncharacterized protein (TIGR02466 family)
MKMQILNTFPTKVGLFSVENNTELNKGLSDFVYSIRNEESPQRSMVGGYHTKEDLLTRNNPFIKSFYSIIVNQISEYFKNFSTKPVGQNTKLVSWAMIYGAGHYSKPHTHPGADFSSAYYCKIPNLPKGEGDFIVTDPRHSAKWDKNYSEDTSLTITPKEGLGIIFPGWLEHYVTPHNLNEDRICITTNIFIDHGTFF